MKQWHHIPDLLIEQSGRTPDKVALVSHEYPIDAAPKLTYHAWYILAEKMAAFWIEMGIEPGDRIAIMAHNRPEWPISDMAILMVGAVVVPIYPLATQSELRHILQEAEVRWIVADTIENVQAVRDIYTQCPSLSGIISLQDESIRIQSDIWTWGRVLECGKSRLAHHRHQLDSRLASLSHDTIACIAYTAGTTTDPRGVILSHGNILSNVANLLQVIQVTPTDIALSILPLSHALERTVGYYTIIAAGATIYYAKNTQSILTEIAAAKPTLMIGVPRVYEKIYDHFNTHFHGLSQKLLAKGIQIKQRQSSGDASIMDQLILKWIDRKIFSQIRHRFGSRLRFLVSGGAPLSTSVSQFFEAAGIPLVEGYGLTEASPVICCNRLNNRKLGSVGLPLPSVTVQIQPDGELWVQGPNVTRGYWKNTLDTEALIENNWLKTGDIGSIDSDGFITILDRKKEIIVLLNGKKIYPSLMEERLKANMWISQAVVFGNHYPFLVALIVPNLAVVSNWAHHHQVEFSTPRELFSHPDVINQTRNIINLQLASLAPFERVQKFKILPNEFTPESGCITPSLKLKRREIARVYKSDLDAMIDKQ